jgi:hypothetical protein
MCLSKVQTNRPKQKSGFGYKCMYEYAESLGTGDRGFLLRMKRWTNNSKISDPPYLQDDHDKNYRNGFHIWKTKRGAEYWNKWSSRVIVKVQYEKATTIGKQDSYSVIVAQRIKLIEIVKGD